jgi:hypothetical protein
VKPVHRADVLFHSYLLALPAMIMATPPKIIKALTMGDTFSS